MKIALIISIAIIIILCFIIYLILNKVGEIVFGIFK